MHHNLDEALFKKQAEVFKAISHKTRLAIVHLLYEGEKSVNDIVEAIGNKERTGISKHLNILRTHSIIDYREEGTSRIYYLKARCLIQAVNCTLQIIN